VRSSSKPSSVRMHAIASLDPPDFWCFRNGSAASNFQTDSTEKDHRLVLRTWADC
jgi:hypothetical protein